MDSVLDAGSVHVDTGDVLILQNAHYLQEVGGMAVTQVIWQPSPDNN